MAPLLALAILSAASMGANYVGQKKVGKARTAALTEARGQRERNAKRAAETAQSTTDILTGTPSNEKEAAAAILAEHMKARDAPDPFSGQTREQAMNSTIATPRSQVLIQDREARRAKSTAYRDQQLAARAKLGAFSDVMSQNNIGVQRNAQDIGQIASSLQNWNQNVLPAQLNSANMAGRNWNTLADALQLAAMVYAPIALTSKAPASVAIKGAAQGGWQAPAAATSGVDYFAPVVGLA